MMHYRELQLPTGTSHQRCISLHLLAKNGASVVGRLLDQVGPYLVEVVAVLDDCSDDTAGEIHRASIRHGFWCERIMISPRSHPGLYLEDVPATYDVGRPFCKEVFPGPFSGKTMLGDFAGARNLGWSRCRGAWTLFLDADDSVDDPWCLPSLCQALAEAGVEVAASRYYHTGASTLRERLCQTSDRVRWRGRAHEVLAGYDPARAAGVDGSLVVRDLRDSSGDGTRTPLRNLKILYHDARSRGWDLSPREKLVLASESRAAMPELAAGLAESYLEASSETLTEEVAWACLVRGSVDESMGRLPEAARWYLRSLHHHESGNVACRLARCLFVLDRHEEAVAAHQIAERCRGRVQRFDEGDDLAGPVKILIASSLAKIGRRQEAREMATSALELYPRSMALRALLEELS